MDSHTLEGLTLRLEAAERGLRGARRAMWMGSLLVAAAIGGGAWWVVNNMPTGASQETVEAQHFVVRDAQGAARAVLETESPGGTQLVFFRDPQPGDAWRERTGPGPFSFGVRALSARTQLMLWDRDGANLQIMPGDIGMAINDKVRLTLEGGGDPRLWIADSTGKAQALSFGLLADLVAKHSASPSPAPKHRRRR